MIKPLYNNILIKPQETDDILKSSQGLLTEIGEVIEVGADVKSIMKGDILAFSKWGVKHVEKGNEKFYFIPEDGRFILGRIE